MRKSLIFSLLLLVSVSSYAQPDDVVHSGQIKAGYSISSAALLGANTEVNILNISHFHSGVKSLKLPIGGLILGSTEVLLGVFSFRHSDYYPGIPGLTSNIKVIYRGQNNLSYVNIAMGSLTVLTSAYNLVFNKRVKKKTTALGLFSYPNQNNSIAMGVILSKKF